MISEAKNIWRKLNGLINTEDSTFIIRSHSQKEQLEALTSRLREIFDEDASNLKKKLNVKGLNNKYSRLETDWIYMVNQAFLSKSEIKQAENEQFVCVVARSMICKKIALEHLEKTIRLIAELKIASQFLLDSENIEISKMRELFELSKRVDRIKGYCREAYRAIDDYCHFLDLAHHILGDKPDLFGKRLRADIYTFQLDTAIKDLFTSRTESCDAAPFLIRSRLEIKLRRLLFNKDVAPKPYLPTASLSLTKLVKSCKRAGIEFTCPTEQLEKVIENLDLVIHLGLKLNSSLLWYSYFIATSLKVIVDGTTQQERKINLRRKVLSLFEDLESQRLAQKTKDSPYFNKSGINILWRY